MDLIFGAFGHQHDKEGLKACFSLNGKRNCFERSLDNGFLFSTRSLTNNEVCLGIEGSQFQYIRFLENGLSITNDSFGLRPLFIYSDPINLLFSTEIEPLLLALDDKIELDHESIASYLKDGILNSGKTFIKGVRNFSPGETIEYIDRELTIKNSSRSFSGFEEKNPAEITQQIKDILSDSLQKWISKYSIQGANLTGGADTRLLLALLEKNQRQDFQFFTDRSPHLNEDEDRDVIIAKELAKRFGLNHEVRVHPINEIIDDKSFLRSEPADVLKLSGNHGGEILGGDVFGAMEFCRATHWREDFSEDYQSLCSLMFRAFFSDIYDGGVFNHWTMPFNFSGRKCAPFWDQRLIHLLSQQDKNDVYHYGLYAELYRKHFPEFTKIPFMSPIATHHKDFIMMERGQNQKLVAKKKVTPELLKKEKESILKIGFFDYHELTNKSDTSIKRALKVNRWIDFFIKEKKWSSL